MIQVGAFFISAVNRDDILWLSAEGSKLARFPGGIGVRALTTLFGVNAIANRSWL